MSRQPQRREPAPDPRPHHATGAQLHAIRQGRLTRANSCTGKHRFTQAKALRMAERACARTGERLHAYPCLFGPHWHVGHAARQAGTSAGRRPPHPPTRKAA